MQMYIVADDRENYLQTSSVSLHKLAYTQTQYSILYYPRCAARRRGLRALFLDSHQLCMLTESGSLTCSGMCASLLCTAQRTLPFFMLHSVRPTLMTDSCSVAPVLAAKHCYSTAHCCASRQHLWKCFDWASVKVLSKRIAVDSSSTVAPASCCERAVRSVNVSWCLSTPLCICSSQVQQLHWRLFVVHW
jgi:hypothetical protein